MRKICKVEGCNEYVCGNGYCSAHYKQIKKSGKIKHLRTKPNEIEIKGNITYITTYDRFHNPQLEKVLIDTEDIGKIKEGRITRGGLDRRVSIYIHGKCIGLSRFLMNPPPEMFVDHIKQNQSDNRKSNLRICTRQQNQFNRRVRGINYRKERKKWSAEIFKSGKHYQLGEFENKDDALEARIKAERELFGEFALIRT